MVTLIYRGFTKYLLLLLMLFFETAGIFFFFVVLFNIGNIIKALRELAKAFVKPSGTKGPSL
jgi:hypothetical protein